MNAQQTYEYARALVDAGVSLIPVETAGERAKKPHYKALVGTGFFEEKFSKRVGRLVKVPRWESFQTVRVSDEDLRAWVFRFGVRGFAMVTGELSGLVALDFDPASLGVLAQLGWTPHVRTPSGGAHVYVRHPGWRVKTLTGSSVKDARFKLPGGLDVRGDGGYVVLPPTETEKGAYVRTGERRALDRDLIPELIHVQGEPINLKAAVGLLLPPAPEPTQAPREIVPVPVFAEHDPRPYLAPMVDRAVDIAWSRGRNEGGFWLARQMRDNGYDRDETLALYEPYASQVPDTDTHGRREPYTYDEYAASVASAFRRAARNPWDERENTKAARRRAQQGAAR